MALKRDKYDIEVQNNDAINQNRILFDFMQRTFNRLDGMYLHENSLLIDTTKLNKPRNQIAVEVERMNRKKG